MFEIPKNFYNVRSNPRQRKSTEGEGGRGTKRLDEVSRVTSQLSSRRNPRPYLFAIYAHLERNLGRAPTAPSTFTTASITRRKNVSLRYVRPPFSLSLSLSLSVAGKGRQRIVFQNFHGGHQWRRVHWFAATRLLPGPPRRFSRIRLGRHEFATLFRHGLFIPFLSRPFSLLSSYLYENSLPPFPPPSPCFWWKFVRKKNDWLPLLRFSVQGKRLFFFFARGTSMGRQMVSGMDGRATSMRIVVVQFLVFVVRTRRSTEVEGRVIN